MGKLTTWIFANQAAEYAYMKLIEAGCKPQEAQPSYHWTATQNWFIPLS